MTEQTARARFVDAYAKLTVWIRQRSDGDWEAIDWYGVVMARGKYRSTVTYEVNQMAADPTKNIYAVAVIVEPKSRQPKRKAKGMRRVP